MFKAIVRALTQESLNVGLDRESVFTRELRSGDRVIHSLSGLRGVTCDVGVVGNIPTIRVTLPSGRVVSGHRQEWRLVERSLVIVDAPRPVPEFTAPIVSSLNSSDGYTAEGSSILHEIEHTL